MICNQLTTQTQEPITVTEAKLYLRIDAATTDEDTLINKLIKAARMRVEKDTNQHLMSQSWEIGISYWPKTPYIQLPIGPAQYVTSIVYTTEDGTLTMPIQDYLLDTKDKRQFPIIRRLTNAWPSKPLTIRGLRATIITGYQEVPEDLTEAIRSLVAYWYDNRETAIASTEYKAETIVLPKRYDDLIGPYILRK